MTLDTIMGGHLLSWARGKTMKSIKLLATHGCSHGWLLLMIFVERQHAAEQIPTGKPRCRNLRMDLRPVNPLKIKN